MRGIIVAVVSALALATAASAAPGYHLDGKGICHGPDNKFTRVEFCQTKRCHDPKTGRIVQCATLKCPLPACCWDNCNKR